MIEGTIKTSKYEIIAIFREEQRKQTEIDIFFNNKSISTQIARVDFAEFHIQSDSKIPAGNNSNLFCIVIQERSSSPPSGRRIPLAARRIAIRWHLRYRNASRLYKDDEIRDFVYAMRMISFVMGAIKMAKTMLLISKIFQMVAAR